MNNPKKLNITGSQIQLLRNWRKLSQRELSIKLGSLGWKISRASLAQIENTQKRVSDCDLIFFAKALNVTIADFFPATFKPAAITSKIRSRRLMLPAHGVRENKRAGLLPHCQRKRQVWPARQNLYNSQQR